MSIIIPLLVMNGILFIITLLLGIADSFLMSYGECRITIKQDDDEKEVTVPGGDTLLSCLTANKIKISSSCAGKASCGYCKVNVLSGGGDILPTEESFMSRKEINEGTRLACQVKVKKDIKVYIPDFITTIKEMVKNRTFDEKKKWKVTIE